MKKRYWIFGAALIGVLAFLIFFWQRLNMLWRRGLYTTPDQIAEPVVKDDKEQWVTIFIHGTFGSPFGMWNVFNTINDEVRNTMYNRVAKKIRSNSFFYTDQIIQQRGLHPLKVTYDVTEVENDIAAHPLAKGYKDVLEFAYPQVERNYFYTFGWSGLLSQSARRYESIRLYNALARELDRFEKQGIKPRIRIISHSHGGNVVLNLALINEVLSHSIENVPADKYLLHPNKQGALRRMHAAIAGLPEFNKAQHASSNKRWDFRPTCKSLTIDEFILFGSPIQPETEHCVDRHTFKRIFSFYSDEDVVQKMDWVSTQRYYSSQKFADEYVQAMKSEDGSTGLYQVRMMQDRPMVKEEQGLSWYAGLKKKMADFAGWFVRQTKDPTHKEMWFLVWDEEIEEPSIKPLPILIFCALMKKLVRENPDVYDVDMNIAYEGKDVRFVVARNKQADPYDEARLDAGVFEEIKKSILKWRPADYSPTTRFKIIHGYAKEEQ